MQNIRINPLQTGLVENLISGDSLLIVPDMGIVPVNLAALTIAGVGELAVKFDNDTYWTPINLGVTVYRRFRRFFVRTPFTTGQVGVDPFNYYLNCMIGESKVDGLQIYPPMPMYYRFGISGESASSYCVVPANSSVRIFTPYEWAYYRSLISARLSFDVDQNLAHAGLTKVVINVNSPDVNTVSPASNPAFTLLRFPPAVVTSINALEISRASDTRLYVVDITNTDLAKDAYVRGAIYGRFY